MIISSSKKAELNDFSNFLYETNEYLNEKARSDNDYFLDKNAQKLEIEVFDALNDKAKNTIFENTIELVSSKYFPDIVVNKYYGVEVKSSQKDFKTLGGSILESTRKEDIERIFLVFGKLKTPVEFKARPYEDCLYDVAVTHYPRYQIDMDLKENETIFYKAGVSYDDFRKHPIDELKKYYKPLLKEGESLWWLDNNDSNNFNSSPSIIRLFQTLSKEEKDYLTAEMFAYFPEILDCSNQAKYYRAVLWLNTNKSILHANIRDSFSAGGKVAINGVLMPKVFKHIIDYKNTIIDILDDTDINFLKNSWQVLEIKENRFKQWQEIIIDRNKYQNKNFASSVEYFFKVLD